MILQTIAIQAFIKKQSANAAYYEENWNERKERKAYYQSFTKDKLLAMTEEDFLEYISRLWAVLMWGNKKYVVDKLIEDNGFSTLKKQLADLLYGSASVEKRWDIFLKSVKGMGPATISELLSYNDGRRKNLFCVAVNLLTIKEIENILQTVKSDKDFQSMVWRRKNRLLLSQNCCRI